MDDQQFDRFVRALHTSAGRRPALALVLAGVAGWMGLAESEARKKKKVTLCLNGQTLTVKKSKKASFVGQGATQGACAASPPPPRPGSPPISPPTSPPPPAGPTCADGIKNGAESDVDCGGSCQRCGTAKICNRYQDCLSGYCSSGRCLPCQTGGQCQGAGNCYCTENGICGDSGAFRFVNVPSCNFCPEGTVDCEFYQDGTVNGVLCFPRCGEPFPE